MSGTLTLRLLRVSNGVLSEVHPPEPEPETRTVVTHFYLMPSTRVTNAYYSTVTVYLARVCRRLEKERKTRYEVEVE